MVYVRFRMTASSVDEDVVSYDGRRARRDRNTEAVLRGCWSLFMEGTLHPTAQQVSDRSGVSLRSVFRHFQNLDGLVLAAIDWYLVEHAHLFVFTPPAPTASLDERIDALVDYRLTLYTTSGRQMSAAVARAATDPQIGQRVAAHRDYVRAVIGALFEPELATMSADDRAMAHAAAQTVIQFEGWEMLSLHYGLRPEQIAAWYRRTLRVALAQNEPNRQ